MCFGVGFLDLSCLGYAQLLQSVVWWLLSKLGSFQPLFLGTFRVPPPFSSISGTPIFCYSPSGLWGPLFLFSFPSIFSVVQIRSFLLFSQLTDSSSPFCSWTHPLSYSFQLLHFSVLAFPFGSPSCHLFLRWGFLVFFFHLCQVCWWLLMEAFLSWLL